MAVSFAGCLYSMLVAGAILWLWLRDRLPALQSTAIGAHGLVASMAMGLGVGLLGAGALWGASRWSQAVRRLEQRVSGVLGPLTETQILLLSMWSAVAEEAFFRLAAQDSLGMPLAVAMFVGANTGPGFWAWAPFALVFGTAFSTMVATGFGLLSATAAHAVINYLSLRRILPP
jgi:hypothetical protein